MKKIDDQLPFLLIAKGKDITVNNVATRAIISDTGERTKFQDDKFMRAATEFKTGDIVQYQNMDWIVSSEVDYSEVSYKARIRKAHEVLKFVKEGTLYTALGFAENYLNNINESTISTDQSVLRFSMADTPDNMKVRVNDRFILFNQAWKTVGVDYTEKGLLTVKMTADAYNPNTDDLTNAIANRWVNKVDQITVNPPDATTPGGDTGTEPTEPTPVDPTPEEPEVPPITGTVTVSLTGAELIYFDTTEVYTATPMLDGVPTDLAGDVAFEITDSVMCVPVITETTARTCSITNGNSQRGVFYLKAYLLTDPTIFVENEIRIGR